jgi:hypothetical protein
MPAFPAMYALPAESIAIAAPEVGAELKRQELPSKFV